MIKLVLLLIVAPLVELYVILQVAHHLGWWQTLALLLVESVIGAWLLRRQGLSTLAHISQAAAERRLPGKELVDGFLLLIAGALMLAPGFISDVVGFLLVIPVTRAPFRARLMQRFKQGRYGGFFATTTGAGARFVGSFGARDVFDASGHDATKPPRTELGP